MERGDFERMKDVFSLLFQVNKTYLELHLLLVLTFGYWQVLILLVAKTYQDALQSGWLSNIHVAINCGLTVHTPPTDQ